jgi:hypothetical protein
VWEPETVRTRQENLTPTGIRSPDRPARSDSLYQQSCPGSCCQIVQTFSAGLKSFFQDLCRLSNQGQKTRTYVYSATRVKRPVHMYTQQPGSKDQNICTLSKQGQKTCTYVYSATRVKRPVHLVEERKRGCRKRIDVLKPSGYYMYHRV